MLSASAALELLQRADNLTRLGRLARELGFRDKPERLTPEFHQQLALPSGIARARMIAGAGALRAMLVEIAPGVACRDVLAETARALTTRSPHCIWIVLGCGQGTATTLLACWQVRRQQRAVRALLVDRHHVYASDVETLCALAASSEGPDVLVHTRWLEILGRDALTRRFHTTLASVVRGLSDSMPHTAPPAARGELALLSASRLLFLAFLQGKGWLNGDHAFLNNLFETGMSAGGRIHERILEPLFFGTLNTRVGRRQPRALAFGRVPYLNGGLFARVPLERKYRGVRPSDEALGRLFGDLLARYRFTPREEPADWSEAAVDPVVLGRAFESLMDPRSRRSSGTFYTPAAVVERAVQLALGRCFSAGESADTLVAALNGEPPADAAKPLLLARVRRMTLLDPACGSGAFLVHALRTLANLHVLLGTAGRGAAREAVLTRSIFGVDVSPTAVWLCQLRLWLCLAVECEAGNAADVPPLPNLDRNIRVGDTLSGSAFSEMCGGTRHPSGLASLRSRYGRAQGTRRRTLERSLDAAERRAAIAATDAALESLRQRRHALHAALRSPDLFGERRPSRNAAEEARRLRLEAQRLRVERQRLRGGGALPFSFPVQFADVAEAGGFDVIVGNPPWVRPHKLPPATRAALRARYVVCRPPSTAAYARGGSFGGQVDLAAPFVERSLALLRPGGTVALLLPVKLWTSPAGAALRRHVLANAWLVAVEDFSSAGPLFEAATYPSLLVVSRRELSSSSRRESVSANGQSSMANSPLPPANEQVSVVIHRRSGTIGWSAAVEELTLTARDTSPWLLVPPPVRRSFDRLAAAGVPLAVTRFGVPRLGVKTGCNAAFVVAASTQGPSLVEVRSAERHGWIERSLLRPALRGELVRAWRPRNEPDEYVIWTHDRADRPLVALPPHASRWLCQWRHELRCRADARTQSAWWRLFRTPAARTDRHRVVWCDIGRAPRALVLEPGDRTVPINTCYVVFADEADAWALAALLNSPLTAAWLRVLAEPARGGYRRYFASTMAALPLPRNESALHGELGALGRAASAGEQVWPASLLEASIAAYGIRQRDVAALLEWHDV